MLVDQKLAKYPQWLQEELRSELISELGGEPIK